MMNGPYNQITPASAEGTAALDRAWLEALPDACVVVDCLGTVVAANENWRRISEEAAGAFDVGVGGNFLKACGTVPGLEAFRVEAERLVAGEQGGRAAAEYALASGSSVRWYFVTAVSMSGGALVSQRDITRRKLAEESSHRLADQRLAEQRYYEDLLANVPAVVWEGACRSDGTGLRMRFVSRHAEHLLGFAAADWLKGEDFFTEITHPDDRPRVAAELAQLIRDGSDGLVACRWVGRDGRTLWVESRVTALRDARTGGVGVRGVTTDVTSRRDWEESLQQRNAELAALAKSLARSNEELDQYAYVTSHDLKAPLRGIANLSNWIEEDLGPAVTEDAHRQLEMLRGRVHRMEALIEGILAYSRVGRVRVKPELVAVGKLLKDIVDLVAPPPGFAVDVAPGMPTLIAERTRLQQVFMNLIANAIKHHHDPGRGRVTIAARDVGTCYEFSVTDNGPGIDPAYHRKVWVIFQTLRARDRVEGTGVGLSLVKKIVEDQRGVVRLESRAGQGSTFSFTWQKDVRTVRPEADAHRGVPHGT
jgi:PAS domain S-box-containing protein